jgi:N-acetyl-alpha-D-muramate 1-phosphate uridylyltransferase
MVRIAGKPFLEYEIEFLKRKGIRSFVLCVGYLSDKIRNHFGDGSRFGTTIEYSDEGENLLGPAGALKKAELLLDETFFVTYGDAYLELDYRKAWSKFQASGKLGMMVVNENHNQYGKSDIAIEHGLVKKYNKRAQTPDMIWINYGVIFLRKKALDLIPAQGQVGEEEFYGALIEKRELATYETKNRFYEIGNPSSMKEFEKYLANSRSSQR